MWSFPKFSSLDFLIVSPTLYCSSTELWLSSCLSDRHRSSSSSAARVVALLHPTTEFQHKLPTTTTILNFLSFYCCWCLTLLDTFVIGEVRRNFVFCNCNISRCSRLFGGRFPRFSRYIRRSFIKYLHHLPPPLLLPRHHNEFFPRFSIMLSLIFSFIFFNRGKKHKCCKQWFSLSLSLIFAHAWLKRWALLTRKKVLFAGALNENEKLVICLM